MRQLLQHETANSNQQFITKCDRGLLHSSTGIAKRDRLVFQSLPSIGKCNSYGLHRIVIHAKI